MFCLEVQQEQCFRFLQGYKRQRGIMPTVQEIANAVTNNSRSEAQKLLDQLENHGYIRRERERGRVLPRSIQLGIPLLGTIAAGAVGESFTDCEPVLLTDVPDRYKKPECYALRVLGDSMIDSHICSGDLVILQTVTDVQALKPGSIVAARVEGEGATLKHFRRMGSDVRLIPANVDFSEIAADAVRVQIQGAVVEVCRTYQPFVFY